MIKRFQYWLLSKKKNVTGIGSKVEDDGRLPVFVENKFSDVAAFHAINDPAIDFSEKDLVPGELRYGFKKYRTKVIEVGEVKALTFKSYTLKRRPLVGGVQISPMDKGWYGTLGGSVFKWKIKKGRKKGNLLKRLGGGFVDKAERSGLIEKEWFYLTNRHVVGIPVASERFSQPLTDNEEALSLYDVGPVKLDSALLKPMVEFRPGFVMKSGPIKGHMRAISGLDVQKHGARTSFTKGFCVRNGVTMSIDFGEGVGIKTLPDLDMYSYMSAGGDSGSWIIHKDEKGDCYAVTLLNSGSSEVTLGIPMEKVLDYFGVSL